MKTDSNSKDGNTTAGTHISYWLDSTIKNVRHLSLKEDLETDVVIVGGGLAGLSTAYCLTQAGKKVVVVEDGFIGSGETGRTTAHLVTALDDRYYNLATIFGPEKAKLIAESHSLAIDFVEHTIKNEKINCDFERLNGYLFLHPSDKKESLKKELQAAIDAGLDVTEQNTIPGIKMNGHCLKFARQAQFHPMKYLAGLSRAIEAHGGKIFTETHAAEITDQGIKTTKGFTVKAKHIVIATNSPVNAKYLIPLKQDAYRTYVIGALIKKNLLPKALWWDTGNFKVNAKIPPYHYMRVHSYDDTHDLLISGGEDHSTGNADKIPEEKRYAALEEWTRERFDIKDIVYRWSGQVMEPMDSIAYIGRNPMDKENVFIVTGDSGNGMTHCSFAGLLITDLITGKENKWEKLYSPSRFTFKESGPVFTKLKDDFIATIKAWTAEKNNVQLSSIKKGEGKVVEFKKEKLAAYRDEEDHLHIVSAVCTHLKCTVGWNNDEKSWDCPCHGSRFTHEGKVINGPANKDLVLYSEKKILKNSKQAAEVQ
jgi:glycine/D-amino acid oxidase-like deaminating enzyme/nitrite reductase/ring-hydroxylating ferredoxin subunit